MNVWWGIWSGYVLPFLILSSILSNGIILLYNQHLSKNQKLRFVYIMVAASNIIITFVFHTETTFLGDGLSFLSSGTIYFYLDHVSSFTCKLMRFLWGFSETFSRWAVFWFSFERYLLCTGKMTFSRIGMKKSSLIMFAIVLLSILINVPTLFIWKIMDWELSVTKKDCVPNEFPEASLVWAIQATLFWYALPSMITAIFNLLILKTIWRRRNAVRRKRDNKPTNQCEGGLNEINNSHLSIPEIRVNQKNVAVGNSIMLVTITSIEVFFTVPLSLGILALGICFAFHLDETLPGAFEIVVIIHFITLTMPLLQGFSEFLFYTISISSFRKKLSCIPSLHNSHPIHTAVTCDICTQ